MARSLTLDAASVSRPERADAPRVTVADATATPPSFEDKVVLAMFAIGVIGGRSRAAASCRWCCRCSPVPSRSRRS
jgi:hypothetical protein